MPGRRASCEAIVIRNSPRHYESQEAFCIVIRKSPCGTWRSGLWPARIPLA
jgi:hypothetical protein